MHPLTGLLVVVGQHLRHQARDLAEGQHLAVQAQLAGRGGVQTTSVIFCVQRFGSKGSSTRWNKQAD